MISGQTSLPTRSLLILQPSLDFTSSSEAASFKSSDKVKSNLAAEKVDDMQRIMMFQFNVTFFDYNSVSIS